jgi:EcsC protein family
MNESEAGLLEKIQQSLVEFIQYVVKQDPAPIKIYVDSLRARDTSLTAHELAKRIVSRKSWKNGAIGALTGIGGFITLPVTVPTDLIASWRIQATMTMAVAYCFDELNDSEEMVTDILLVMSGDAAKEALKRMGIETAKAISKKMVQKYISREVMKKIWKVIPQKIITKAGEKSLTSFMKMVPLVGAPVGFGFDFLATRAIGKTAIRYYGEV